ncbi:MAG: hypothetical protein ABIJ35_00400 [Acidobacteriota bacterium]
MPIRFGGTALLVVLCLVTVVHPSTVFLASDGGETLVGCNEDFDFPLSKMTFVPGADGKYGAVYFGFEIGWQQAGLNEKGLFFKWNATPPVVLNLPESKEAYNGNLMEAILQQCGSVEEALALLDRYHTPVFEKAQLFLGDASGASAVVEGDAVRKKEGKYQIMTNFRQSRTKPEEYRCPRFIMVDQMIFQYPAHVDYFRSILSATHQELGAPTQYSVICDLKKLVIYLYHFHNFENQLVMDIKNELAKESRSYELEKSFPKTYAFMIYKSQWMKQHPDYQPPTKK